jgi:uncharacterized protein YegL
MAKKKVVTKTVVTEEIITDEKTQIVCILDRSGTMSSIINTAIDGFNEYLNKQKQLEDDATITVALFDDQYDLLYDNVPIKEVEPFTKDVWYPRGMTALHDAIGKTIETVRGNHKKMKKKDRPDKVLVCIVTDGLENYSKEYNLNDIVKLTRECEADGWNFVYLAANQDAFDVGVKLGVSAGNTFNWTADADGVSNFTASLNNATTYYRSTTADVGDYGNLMSDHSDDEEN